MNFKQLPEKKREDLEELITINRQPQNSKHRNISIVIKLFGARIGHRRQPLRKQFKI